MRTAEALHLVDAGFCPHIPELDDTVIADAAKFCILDRIEGYLLNAGQVALQFCREPYIGLLRIPYRAVDVSRGSSGRKGGRGDAGFAPRMG